MVNYPETSRWVAELKLQSPRLSRVKPGFLTRRITNVSVLLDLLDARLTEAVEFILRLSEQLRSRPFVIFVENSDGSVRGPGGASLLDNDAGRTSSALRLQGSDVEVRLSSRNFVFKELELPARAEEFLQGVVRSQIDVLTPWKMGEVVFGWRLQKMESSGRILVTIAATSRKRIAPLLGLVADRVVLSTARDDNDERISVLVFGKRAEAQRVGYRIALLSALCIGGLFLATALGLQWTVGETLSERTDALQVEILRQSNILHVSETGGSSAPKTLYEKKRTAPVVVVILEELSRVIPDDAYLTAIHIDGGKLEISGIATNAAALIPKIEGSPPFSHAAFSGSIVRNRDTRENFRIQAHVAPLITALQ